MAVGEPLGFLVPAAHPDRTDGVDHMLCGQPIPRRCLGLSGSAAAEGPALGNELRAGSAVNRAVDASATEQRRVRGVDDRVDRLKRDVSERRFDDRGHAETVVHATGEKEPRATDR